MVQLGVGEHTSQRMAAKYLQAERKHPQTKSADTQTENEKFYENVHRYIYPAYVAE